MQNLHRRIIINTILVLALASQGVEPLMAGCDMSSENQSEIQIDMQLHSEMQHVMESGMSEHNMPEHDCCNSIDCSCLNGTCSTSLFVSLDGYYLTTGAKTSKNHMLMTQLSSAISQDLTRPPILA